MLWIYYCSIFISYFFIHVDYAILELGCSRKHGTWSLQLHSSIIQGLVPFMFWWHSWFYYKAMISSCILPVWSLLRTHLNVLYYSLLLNWITSFCLCKSSRSITIYNQFAPNSLKLPNRIWAPMTRICSPPSRFWISTCQLLELQLLQPSDITVLGWIV